jgi:hypothetical protein
MSTLAAKHGSHDQKGKVMGILRSLGALARALGPVFASTGNLMKIQKYFNSLYLFFFLF